MNPFSDPPPQEVPLPRAPLVRVLCQVRFPPILSIESDAFVASFQEALRKAYPVLSQEQTEGFTVGPAGIIASKPQTAWRFQDLAAEWRVSLTPNFLAIETTRYTSRDEFMDRLHAVVVAAKEHLQPAVATRVGIRYVDRLVDDAVSSLSKFVRPEVLGVVNSELGCHLGHSVTESVFNSEHGQMLARSGLFPPRVTLDPAVMAPVEVPSWILDLDMFSHPGQTIPFDAEQLVVKVRAHAERIHAFFRWCVTEDFLRHYGGKP